MGAESCRWISMQTVALLYPKCAISYTMKSQRSISNNELQPPTQCHARVNLIVISKTFFWYSCNLNVYLWQRNVNTANKVFFFLTFKQSVWPFSGLFYHCLAFYWNFIWQPCQGCCINRHFYMTLQHGSQQVYQLTLCQILLIRCTVERLIVVLTWRYRTE